MLDTKTPLWSKLYSQKCHDLGIMPTDNLYERFIVAVAPQIQNGILALADQGLKATSIPIVCELLSYFNGIVHTLDLSMNPILDEGAALLLGAGPSFTDLKTIRLRSIGLSPTGFDYFFTTLRKNRCLIECIDLSSTSSAERRNRPGEIGCHALASFISNNSTIKSLIFTNTQLRGNSGATLFKAISHPSSLTHLHLQNTDISNKAVEYIFTRETPNGVNMLSELIYVDLSGNPSTLTGDCCQAIETGIKNLKHLHTLILSKNITLTRSLILPFSALRYKSADLAAASEAYNKRMQERTRWRHEMFKSLCPGLKNFIETGKVISERVIITDTVQEAQANDLDPSAGVSTPLKQVDCQTPTADTSQNNVPAQIIDEPSDGEKETVVYFGETCSLRALDVSDIPLSHEAIAQLALALQKNETLESINLSYCSIDLNQPEFKIAFEALIVSLMRLPSLKTLLLTGNNIGNQGAIFIGTNIANSESIETLELCHCGILDPGISSIAKAIPSCTSLRILNLKGNNGTDVSARIIYASLSTYHKLTTLNLELNRISYSLYERINALVNNNLALRLENVTSELEDALQDQAEQLTKVMNLKNGIQQKHNILAEKCVDLIDEIDKCYAEHTKWTTNIDNLQNTLDEARKDNNIKEGKLNSINQQISQMTSKGEAEIATIELKRKQARDKASATLNKITELEAAMQAKEVEFQEQVIKPKQEQLVRLRNELDLQMANQIRVLGILLATEQTLIAEKKITIEAPQHQAAERAPPSIQRPAVSSGSIQRSIPSKRK